MKRIEIHSHEPRVNVYLTSQNADKAKRYTIAVENLSVPAIESRILNTPLFEIRRRFGIEYPEDEPEDDSKLGIAEKYRVFTPSNVRSLSHLVFQLNAFLKEFQLRMTTAGDAAFKDLDENGVYDDDIADFSRDGTEFDEEKAADWYTLEKDNHISAVCRSDGRIGFKFGVDFQKLFVFKFSDEGKRIFGIGDVNGYFAIDANGDWGNNFLTYAPDDAPDEVHYNLDLPPAADLETQLVFTESVYPFVDHRSELVVQCSLPLSQTGEGTEEQGTYKRQLVSYRFPEYETEMGVGLNGNVLNRTISEVRHHTFEFEKNTASHNEFILTGTDMQNFNIYLVHRVHTYKNNGFVLTETPYEMPERSTFILRLRLVQV